MTNTTTQDVTFLTKAELANRWRVKSRTIELWVKAKKIPAPSELGYKNKLWHMDDVVAHEMKIKEACKNNA